MRRRQRARAEQLTRLDDLHGYLADGKPVLVDIWQTGCQPCRMMDGIVDELAAEFDGRAHVVKLDVRRVPGAAEAFGIRSPPTFIVLSRAPKPLSKKARRRGEAAVTPVSNRLNPRWRASGMVRKDVLAGALQSNGAFAAGIVEP